MRVNRLRQFETNDPFHSYNFARLGEILKCDMNWQNPPDQPWGTVNDRWLSAPKPVAAVGFEPTPPKRLVPKTSALDHSATLPLH